MKNLGKKVLLATLFGVVVYAAVAFASDVRKLRELLVDFNWLALAGAFGLAFTNYLLRFAKWEFYLRRLGIGMHATGQPYKPLPMGESFAVFVSGFAMSITPGKAGEVFKSVLLASSRGVPVARSAPIVVADRLTDLLALIVLVALGSASFPGYGWIALAAAGMVAAVLVFVVFEGLTHRMIAIVETVSIGRRIAPRLREAYAALREVTTPGALLGATVLSVGAWALECTALWVILEGLHQRVSVPLAFFAYATATIAGAIAMLPGGLGGTEFTMREILRAVGGVPAAAAGAATLLVRLATLWFAVVLGFIALAVFRRRYDRHIADAAGGEEAGAPAT